MQVETFECQETAAEPIEAAEEAIALIEKMGLEGQLALVKPRQGDERGTRMPYREMTGEERFVYGVHCPEQIALSKYNATPIPLRVLQVAAHAKECGMFDHIYVWDRASVAVKDPVLVGYKGKYDWSPDKVFILARWGEVLESFPILLRDAIKAKREQIAQAYRSIAQKAKAKADGTEEMTDAELTRKQSMWLPSLSE